MAHSARFLFWSPCAFFLKGVLCLGITPGCPNYSHMEPHQRCRHRRRRTNAQQRRSKGWTEWKGRTRALENVICRSFTLQIKPNQTLHFYEVYRFVLWFIRLPSANVDESVALWFILPWSIRTQICRMNNWHWKIWLNTNHCLWSYFSFFHSASNFYKPSERPQSSPYETAC